MPFEQKAAAFLAASAALAYASSAALRSPKAHGFYRFLAWEAILALFLVNVEHWFRRPFCAMQIVSWLCLSVSLVLVIHGVYLLRRSGRPTAARHDPTLLAMERTTELITVGAFRYIRHPMYSSLLFLAWGIFFKSAGWLSGGLAILATAFLLATAVAEERENLRFFGDAYRDYMRRTKRFIPFLF